MIPAFFPLMSAISARNWCFAIRRNVDEHSKAIVVLKTLCRGAAEPTGFGDYFVRDAVQFTGSSWNCDFGYAQRIWRGRQRRGALERFCDLLAHLGLKQRVIRFLLSCLKINQRPMPTFTRIRIINATPMRIAILWPRSETSGGAANTTS